MEPTTVDHSSFSKIEAYLKCPMQYKIVRIDRYKPDGSVNIPLTIGKVCHEVIASALSHKMKGTPLGRSAFTSELKEWREILIDKLKDKAGEYTKKLPIEDVAETERQFFMLMMKWYEVVYPEFDAFAVEKEIKFPIVDGVEFLMYIDAIRVLPDGARRIIDWKVTKSPKSQFDTDSSLQLSIYSMATGILNVGFTSLVRPKEGKESNWEPAVKVTTARRSMRELNWAITVIKEALAGISANYFPPCSPSNFLCNEKYCDCWPVCRGKGAAKKPVWLSNG